MKIIDRMAEKVRNSMRSFLKIEPATQHGIYIHEKYDYESNAARNRMWYRGDASELEQFFKAVGGNRTLFWAAVPTTGLELQKRHTGLPGIIIDTLVSIVKRDLNDITVEKRQSEWKEMSKKINIKELIEEALTETLVVGDGAFKISIDESISPYPIVEFVSGEDVEYKYKYGQVEEIVFKKVYINNSKTYVLKEYYGRGYVIPKLYYLDKEVPLKCVPELAQLESATYEPTTFIMAVPFRILKSNKWKGRGKSVYETKSDCFDSLDETWSQWMDALRKGRSKEYIPDTLLPNAPGTGGKIRPNAFDNAFIVLESDMAEGAKREIELKQPAIPHESYLSTYITALDLCLQGIISPSTLGIDTKKLDNADAQREKEKTTLYTRNKIIEALSKTIPELLNTIFKTYDAMKKKPVEEYEVTVSFGEYANPSFESQVETVGKAKTQGIMSVEAAVDELYGDSKDDDWKAEEVARLKAEQGVQAADAPEVGMDFKNLSERPEVMM